MPPRGKKKPADDEDDDGDDEDFVIEGSEEEEAPKKKKAAAKPSKKRAKDEDDDFLDDDEDLEEEKPKKKSKAPSKPSKAGGKAAKGPKMEIERAEPKKHQRMGKQPVQDDRGWVCVPPGLMYQDFGTEPSAKVAAFDAEHCLMATKSGTEQSKDEDDWRFMCKKVPSVLKDLHSKGYKIVVFSNQSHIKTALIGKAATVVKAKLGFMQEKVGVPMLFLVSTGSDQNHKPETGMWEFFSERLNGGLQPDKSKSFYCGSNAGRESDPKDKETDTHVDYDREFAARVGVEFKLPEDVFGPACGRHGTNSELVQIFKEMSAFHFANRDDKNSIFKATALRKACVQLAAFEDKIGEHNLKAVNALPGVGKGSLTMIKEYLETGKVEELEQMRAIKEGKEAAGDKADGGSLGAGFGAGPSGAPGTVPAPGRKVDPNALKFM